MLGMWDGRGGFQGQDTDFAASVWAGAFVRLPSQGEKSYTSAASIPPPQSMFALAAINRKLACETGTPSLTDKAFEGGLERREV